MKEESITFDLISAAICSQTLGPNNINVGILGDIYMNEACDKYSKFFSFARIQDILQGWHLNQDSIEFATRFKQLPNERQNWSRAQLEALRPRAVRETNSVASWQFLESRHKFN